MYKERRYIEFKQQTKTTRSLSFGSLIGIRGGFEFRVYTHQSQFQNNIIFFLMLMMTWIYCSFLGAQLECYCWTFDVYSGVCKRERSNEEIRRLVNDSRRSCTIWLDCKENVQTIVPEDMNGIHIHNHNAKDSCWVWRWQHRRLCSAARVHNGTGQWLDSLESVLWFYLFQMTLHNRMWSEYLGIFPTVWIQIRPEQNGSSDDRSASQIPHLLSDRLHRNEWPARKPELLQVITSHSDSAIAFHNAKAAQPKRGHICTLHPVSHVPQKISRRISSHHFWSVWLSASHHPTATIHSSHLILHHLHWWQILDTMPM
jgi:hypothetical protein